MVIRFLTFGSCYLFFEICFLLLVSCYLVLGILVLVICFLALVIWFLKFTLLLFLQNIFKAVKWLPVSVIIMAVACTSKKQAAPIDEMAVLNRQIAERGKQIVAAFQQNDTTALLRLYREQAAGSKRAGNWAVFCRSNLGISDLYYDSSSTVSEPFLNAIIELEDTLRRDVSLQPLLAEAYGRRYFVYQEKGLYYNIIHDCEKYLEYSNPSLDSAYLVYVLNQAGVAASVIGDQQQSVIYLERLLNYVTAQNDAEEVASASVNLANSYNQNHEPGRAIPVALNALRLNAVSPQRRAYLNAVLAEAYNQLEKKQEALRYVDAAIPLLLRLPADIAVYERLANIYRVQGDIQAALRQPGAASAAYQRSLYYRARGNAALSGREAGKTFIALGELAQAAQQPDSALYYYNRALQAVFPHDTAIGLNTLPREDQLYHENTIMEALDAASTAYVQQYEIQKNTALLKQALQCIHLAFGVDEQLRQLYIYDNSKYRQGTESRERSRRAIDICRLLQKAEGGNWMNTAFAYAEKSRANALLDKIKENLLSGIRNDTAFAQTRRLWAGIKNLEDQLYEAQKDSTGKERLSILLKEKGTLEAAFSRNRNRINTLLQNASATGKLPDMLLAANREKLLETHDAVIEYFAGDSLLYRFVLQKGKENVEMAVVPLAVSDSLVKLLLPYLTDKDKYNNDPSAYNSIAIRLHETIFPPLDKEQGKVLVVADGLLQFLPFEALMSGRGKPEFLVNSYVLTAAFSCASLLQQMNMAEGNLNADAIAFAPFIKQGKDGLPALPQTAAEVESVRRAGEVVAIFINEQATAQQFMEQAGKGKILHLASHAYAGDGDSVPPRIAFPGAHLSLEQVYALQLNNRLVVLSACETGIGQLVTAEGALSLARGFYYAGARNVINSLWEVNDGSAAQIFEYFYHHLKKTGSINRSLALAQQEYIKNAPLEKRSPYYWASFICIGDGKYAPPKDNTRLILIGLGGLLGLIGLMILFRRR